MTRPSYLIDPDQVDLDELTARRLERDRHREPGRRHREAPNLAARRSLEIRFSTDCAPIACPTCHATCWAPRDSRGERIDCVECDSRLVTRLGLAGEVELVMLEGGAP